MPNFIYKAKDNEGKLFSGILEADNKKDLRKKLRNAGFYVTSVRIQKEKTRLSLFEKKINLDTLIIFTHQLTSMIEAGFPIIKALDVLWKEIDHPNMQIVISQIKNRINSGSSLSEAVNEFPEVFPVIYRSLLTVAESGAGMVPILKKLTEYFNKQKEFIVKIKKATTYPLIVITFAIFVVIGMLTFVVPVFRKVFTQIKVELPLPTQLIIGLSEIFRTFYFWLIVLGIAAVVYFLYRRMRSSPKWLLQMDKMKLKLPLFGKIFYAAAIGRFTRTLSLLLSAGLPVVQSIDVSKGTAVNKEIEESLNYANQQVLEGVFLAEALRQTKIFPTLLIEMTSVGEQSGTLAEMLEKVADHFEEDLDYRINKFLTLLEPMMIIVLGCIVAFILLSIYLPIFKLMQGIQ